MEGLKVERKVNDVVVVRKTRISRITMFDVTKEKRGLRIDSSQWEKKEIKLVLL